MAKQENKGLDLNSVLPEEVKAQYKVVDLPNRNSHRIVFHLYGEVDFSKLSLAKAKHLVARKFPFLTKIDAKSGN